MPAKLLADWYLPVTQALQMEVIGLVKYTKLPAGQVRPAQAAIHDSQTRHRASISAHGRARFRV